MIPKVRPAGDDIKSCCAAVYGSDWANLLLGEFLHPGGLNLTERLGKLLDLRPGDRVLDVASGTGRSAVFIAERFGYRVIGVDYGTNGIEEATRRTAGAGLEDNVSFEQADAEHLPFATASFDAVICACAFCTFQDKHAAAGEFSRVLRDDGRLGLSDLTRIGTLPAELDGLLAWVACVADAQSIKGYVEQLAAAGFVAASVESHDHVVSELIDSIRASLLGAELLVRLKKLDLPDLDFDQARSLAKYATQAINEGRLGYALMIGTKPGPVEQRSVGESRGRVYGDRVD